jgi:hypothetical protein
MTHPEQDQHKIPQVYLKKFGYEEKGQWKVSVIKNGEKFTRQKSIGSFTAITNVFDIDSDDPRIPRMFERLNCDIENEYNNIVADIETNKKLSEKSYAFLLQLIANLIVRSDVWRDWALGLLKHENKQSFLKSILAHHCKDEEELMRIEERPFYRILVESKPEDVLNRVLIYFIDYFLIRLWHYEIVIIESQFKKPWFTTTNPVILNLKPKPFDIFSKESEIYFPLTPKHLLYLHHKDSLDKENELRQFETNRIYVATDDQTDKFQKLIISNMAEYVIIEGQFKYKAV